MRFVKQLKNGTCATEAPPPALANLIGLDREGGGGGGACLPRPCIKYILPRLPSSLVN